MDRLKKIFFWLRVERFQKFAIFALFFSFIGISIFWGIFSIQSPYPKNGEPCLLFSNNTDDDLRRIHIQAIQRAKESVYLFIYSLADPYIIDALQKKANEGILVTVIHDAHTPQNGFAQLGNPIRCFVKEGRGLMHQKILIIDQKELWIGSANFTTSSLKVQDNLVMSVLSSSLAQAILGRHSYLDHPLDQQHCFEIGGQNLEFWSLPDEGETGMSRLIQLIDKAKISIKIAMFTWTHPLLTAAIIRASQRGVSIEVVMDKHQAQGANRKCVKQLLQAHVPLYLSYSSLFHLKMAFIDQDLLILGSANWTKAAFTFNDDCFLIIHPLNKKQKRKLNALWKTIECRRQEMKDGEKTNFCAMLLPMKLGLFGFGKMNQLVASLATEEKASIVAIESSSHKMGTLNEADVGIDFSHSSCVFSNLERCQKFNIPLLIGTTGWEHNLEECKEFVLKNQMGALYSPNFSLGIYLFSQILKQAAFLLEKTPYYNLMGIETHHQEKKDAPSGTALSIARIFENKLAFHSIRFGSHPGKHEILCDSPFDSISLVHEARNKIGFAKGAYIAARWLKEKKGWYTIDDVYGSLYSVDHSFP